MKLPPGYVLWSGFVFVLTWAILIYVILHPEVNR